MKGFVICLAEAGYKTGTVKTDFMDGFCRWKTKPMQHPGHSIKEVIRKAGFDDTKVSHGSNRSGVATFL